MWDEENLYLAGEIADDNPFIRFMAYDIEGNDGLALYLGTDPYQRLAESSMIPLISVFSSVSIQRYSQLESTATTSCSRKDRHRGLGRLRPGSQGCQYAIEETEVGFNIEIKLPLPPLATNRFQC